MKNNRVKKAIMLLLVFLMGVVILAKVDEKSFDKEVSKQFENLVRDDKIISYSIDSKEVSLGTISYRITVNHKKKNKYAKTIVISRARFSSDKFKLDI